MINGKPTEDLLFHISQRLSGREDCRNLTYTVIIDDTGVHMTPPVFVYPNRYCKKQADKLDIVSWVHQTHMKSTLLSQFVFGTYQYRKDGESKKRRWTRIC